MTTTIGRDGAFALKIFPQYPPAAIASMAAVSQTLRTHGVPTPETTPDFHARGIRLRWIEGPTLKQQLERSGPARSLDDVSSMAAGLATAMGVIGKLHSVDLSQHDLQIFDPFRHIDRRLAQTQLRRLPAAFASDAELLRGLLLSRLSVPDACGAVHGDFHAGQLIQDRDTSKWWLIDLDDAALGPPEADIANFAVHLATSPVIVTMSVLPAYSMLLELAAEAYGRSLDVDRLEAFAAAAFLRRALKKAELGGDMAWTSTLLAAGFRLVS